MVREISAGGVVLRKMRGRWFIAAIEPHMKRPKKSAKSSDQRRKSSSAAVTALPKGAIDEGEKPDETALREVNEETGLRADLVSKLADIKYVYVRNWGDRARVFKIVTFYLLLYRSGRIDNISQAMRVEVRKAFWLPLDEASKALSYKGEREVAEQALQYVTAHPELGDHAADTSR
jgi:8-oxo-dGTP pyrophosphatase MutT (NUDIX family)